MKPLMFKFMTQGISVCHSETIVQSQNNSTCETPRLSFRSFNIPYLELQWIYIDYKSAASGAKNKGKHNLKLTTKVAVYHYGRTERAFVD